MVNEFRGWNDAILEYYQFDTVNIADAFGVLISMSVIYRIMYFLVMQYMRTGKR